MILRPSVEQIGDEEVIYFHLVTGPEDREAELAVGKILLEFGRIEYILKTAIEQISRTHKAHAGHATAFSEGFNQAESERTFDNIADAVKRLYCDWQEDPDKQQVMALLLDCLKELYIFRNHLVHGCWSTSAIGTHRILRSRQQKGALDHTLIEVETAFLYEVYQKLNYYRFALCVGLMRDNTQIGFEVPIRGGKRIRYTTSAGD